MHYKYQEKYATTDDVKWSDNIPFVGINLGIGYKNFSIDVSAQQSDSVKDGLFSEKSGLRTDITADLSRTDYAVNVGYKIRTSELLNKLLFIGDDGSGDSLSFFTGYKMSQSEITELDRRTSGSGIFFKHYTQFETTGPFLGMAYGRPIGERSNVGISLAYAWLDTDYTSTRQAVTADSTDGLTVSLKWSFSLTRNWTYSLSIDGYRYKMDARPDRKENKSEMSSIEESVINLKSLFIYSF